MGSIFSIFRPDFTWPRPMKPTISKTTPPIPRVAGRLERKGAGSSAEIAISPFARVLCLLWRRTIWCDFGTPIWTDTEVVWENKPGGSCCNADGSRCWDARSTDDFLRRTKNLDNVPGPYWWRGYLVLSSKIRLKSSTSIMNIHGCSSWRNVWPLCVNGSHLSINISVLPSEHLFEVFASQNT